MPDASHFPAVPGVEIREVIGHGGFATVYSGFQAAFNRLVAVKVLQRSELDLDARQRFDRECQVMGTLSNHPYIVTLYVAGYTEDERPYMVMPFVGDGTLADRIRSGGAMPWREVVSSGVRLAGALETAHRADVLHRDIKPANVLRAEYGDLLGDFGIARIAGGHETQSGVITASIAHAPPEVLEGEAPDARADVYSLGSTLFEALSGRAAFTKSADSVGFGPMIRRILLDAPPRLPPETAPPAVSNVIERALSKDKADRPATAEEFGEELRDAQRSLSTGPTDMLVLGSAAARAAAVAPEASRNATVVFDAADRLEPDDLDAKPVAAAPLPAEPPVERVVDATRARAPHVAAASPHPHPQHAAAAPPATRSRRSPNGWALAGIIGIVAVLLAGAAVLISNRGDETPQTSIVPGTETPSTTDEADSGVANSVDSTTTSSSSTTTTTSTTEPSVAPLVLPPGDPVQIQMLNPRIESDVLEGLVRDFEAENPAITVEIVEQGGYETSLNLLLNDEVQPDVALLAERAVQSVVDQLDYMPMEDFIARDDFDASVLLANAADMYSTPEGLAAMPYNIAIPMIYANGEVLERAGVEFAPDASLTTAGLLDRCGVLSTSVETCMEFRLSRFIFAQIVTNSGGRFLDTDGFEGSANAAVFDGEIARRAFSFMTESVRVGDAVPFEDSRLFDDGEVAFFFDTSSGLGSLDRANDAADDPVEIVSLGVPHLAGVEPTGVVPGGGALWIFDRGDERRAIASWLLVDYLSELPQLLRYHSASGYVPARVDAAGDDGFIEFWSRKPFFRGAYDELVESSTLELPNDRDGRAGPFHPIDRAFADRIEQAQLGELEIDEAFDALVDDVNRLLMDYNDANA